MGKKLLVTNLPLHVDSATLEDMFTLVGNVLMAKVECNDDSGTSRGIGHVEMTTDQEAQDCIDHFNGQSKSGHRISVREDKPHVPKPITAKSSLGRKERGKSV